MTKVKGGVPIRRVPRTPSVVIQAGQRVFHKRADGTYDPSTITLRAVVQNVTNPRYQWGRILNGNFRPYSVTIEAMTVNPAHAGVVAVRVEGDNIPGYIQATESISIVEDGAPAVQYKIVVSQSGMVVTSISCDSQGNPKIYYRATATLYKITGNTEELCPDYVCTVAYYRNNVIENAISGQVNASSYTFNVSGDYDSMRIAFVDGDDIVVETTVPKVRDGSQGIPGSSGYTYRPRGMFTPGDTYVYNDMYRDIVLSWFNSRLHTFRVKVKGSSVTVRPTSSNGDDNWEVANELKFIATDLLLAQNAVIDVLGSSKIFVGELDNTEGWEITKGAIRHSATGLELTKDGKLLSPKDGIKIGTQSVEEMLDGIQVGSRNYAHGTSGEWGKSVALQNALNQVIDLHPCYLADLKVGDAVYVSFDIEFKNITKGPGAIVTIQAPGNVTGWDDGGITMGDITQRLSAGNGEAHITLFNTVTAAHLNNTIWPMNARFDYMSGSVRFKNFKFGIGNKSTDWSPAPEDFVETGIDISNRKITLKADTTVFKNNAGEDIAVFENDKIKASMIDVDNLEAKKVKSVDSYNTKLTLDAMGLNVGTASSRNLIELKWGEQGPFSFGTGRLVLREAALSSVVEAIFTGNALEFHVGGRVRARLSANGLIFYNSSGNITKSYMAQ